MGTIAGSLRSCCFVVVTIRNPLRNLFQLFVTSLAGSQMCKITYTFMILEVFVTFFAGAVNWEGPLSNVFVAFITLKPLRNLLKVIRNFLEGSFVFVTFWAKQLRRAQLRVTNGLRNSWGRVNNVQNSKNVLGFWGSCNFVNEGLLFSPSRFCQTPS